MVVEVVRADDRHLAALAAFYRAVWDPAATPDTVARARAASAAANPVQRGEVPPTFLFLQGGTALGHVTTIPVRIACAGRERPGHWLKGLMVLPEHRNGPVGMLLLKEAVRQLGLQLAMVVAEAPRRLYGALGFRDLGAIPNWLRPLRPARIVSRVDPVALPGIGGPLRHAVRLAQRTGLASVAGAAAGLAAAAWAGSAGRPPADVRTAALQTDDRTAVDALWRDVVPRLGAASVRDAYAWWWRYGAAPYSGIAAWRGDRLIGVAALRAPGADGDPRLRGLRVATLADALFAPGDRAAAVAVLAAAERAARAADADALLCSASDARLTAALRARAFLPLGATVHCVIRDPDPLAPPFPGLADWWLWRGDSSADEAL